MKIIHSFELCHPVLNEDCTYNFKWKLKGHRSLIVNDLINFNKKIAS